MNEADFERAVVDLAHLWDWKVAGFRPARTKQGWRTAVKYDGAGYPDLTMCQPKRRLIIFAELKSDKGYLSDEQIVWRETITQSAWETADVRYYNWKPADADEIARLLSAGRIKPGQWRLQ